MKIFISKKWNPIFTDYFFYRYVGDQFMYLFNQNFLYNQNYLIRWDLNPGPKMQHEDA